jgi:hypothetical protein
MRLYFSAILGYLLKDTRMNTYPSAPADYPETPPESNPATVRHSMRLAIGALSGVLLVGACSSPERPADTPQPIETTVNAPQAQANDDPSGTPDTAKPTASSAPKSRPTERPQSKAAEKWRPSSRSTSYNEVVRGLDDLEKRCERRMFVGAMEFFEVPHGQEALREAVNWHPSALQQLDDAKYKPTVILEPGSSLEPGNSGDSAAYFTAMKKSGLKASQWGRVVVVPELVVGEWSHNKPAVFAPAVNTQLRNLKQAFPSAEGTILIDTAPQETNAIASALKQGQKLDTSLYTSVGVQAYANGEAVTFKEDGSADISSYLSLARIKKITSATGKNRIWLNTGITKYDEAQGKRYTTQQRIAVARAVAEVVKQAKNAGIAIDDVMLFAEDKSAGDAGDQGRDFSISKGEERIITTLHDQLRAIGVPLTGFAVD